MGKLIYVTPASLDGYIRDGEYDWSNPGEEGHQFFANLMAPVGTYIYGRRMYETMAVWESPEFLANADQSALDFARVWQAADKIVYSGTLTQVSTSKTKLEHEFDPEAIRKLKAGSSKDISIGGPKIAGEAIRHGLVDEYHLVIVPMLIGGNIPVFPKDVFVHLKLIEERKFGDGWLYLRYHLS